MRWESDIHSVSMRQTYGQVGIRKTDGIDNVRCTSGWSLDQRELQIRHVILYKYACEFLMFLSGMTWKIVMDIIVRLNSHS